MVQSIETREPSVTKSLVKQILENPLGRKWTIQGLGMLRLYLDEKRRLHIWDDRYQVDNVSQMHTHPWDFRSTVIAGVVRNIRYQENEKGTFFYRQMIHCGEGGGLIGDPDTTNLIALQSEVYVERETYSEEAHEIHISKPERGTVTIVKREFKEDTEHAYVYWAHGDWVSAEPRPASNEEIMDITQYSLQTWF